MSAALAGERIAVVGAGSGIGRATALHLAASGAVVACLDIDAEAASAVAGGIEAAGGQAVADHIDVSDEASVTATFKHLANGFGRPRGLLNCAGITGELGVPSHAYDLDVFDRTISVNLRGALLASRAVIPAMVEAGYGRVVHLSSIAGKEGNPNMVGYSASKAGLIGMVKAMGKEYAGTGVTVNAVAPAVIATEFIRDQPQETIDYMVARIPMGRVGEPDEAAELLAWMLSPACSFTTGFTFDLSGGRATY